MPHSLIVALIYCFVGMTSAFQQDDSDLIVNLINDARTSNLAKFQHGTMDYTVSHAIRNKQPIKLKANLVWTNRSAFWTYKIGDPSKLITGNTAYSKDINAAPTEYMLLDDDKAYVFNYYTNTLHVHARPSPGHEFSTYYLFDVFPQTLWSNCCPPFQSAGRAWDELLGKTYQSLFPGSKVNIARATDDLIKQEQVRPDGSVVEMMFSLENAGNLLSMTHNSTLGSDQSMVAHYEWAKTKDDSVALSRIQITRGGTQHDVANPNEVIEIQVSKCSNELPPAFNLGTLKLLLPKNAMVVDHIRNTTYALNPEFRKQPSVDQFRDLIDALSRKGYFSSQ